MCWLQLLQKLSKTRDAGIETPTALENSVELLTDAYAVRNLNKICVAVLATKQISDQSTKRAPREEGAGKLVVVLAKVEAPVREEGHGVKGHREG